MSTRQQITVGSFMVTQGNASFGQFIGFEFGPEIKVEDRGNFVFINGTGKPSSGVVGDVQLSDGTGGFVGDDQFNWDATQKNLRVGEDAQVGAGKFRAYAIGHATRAMETDTVCLGEGCEAYGFNSTAIGYDSIARGFASVAIGYGSQTGVDAVGAVALGVSAVATRPRTLVHSSGLLNIQGLTGIDLLGEADGSPVNLQTSDIPLSLTTESCNAVRITVTGVTTDGGTKRASEVHECLITSLAGPALVLDSDVITAQGSSTNPVVGFSALGWAVEITAPGGLPLRIRCRPGADRVRFAARVEWLELGNIGISPAIFSPADLAGLVLWNKNSSLAAGAVATWADSSGGGNTTTVIGAPVAAADPLYDGLLSVPFDGATQSMLTASLTLGPYTIFQVLRVISGDGFLTHRNDGTDIDYTYKTTGNTLNVVRSGVTSSYNLTNDWAFGTTARTVATRFNGTHVGHGMRINGVEQVLSSVVTDDPGIATSAQQIDMLGGLVSTVGEMIVYDRALTTDECVQVETYLLDKFNHY